MPAFTQRLTLAWEKLLGDQWGVTGKTVEYIVESAKVMNADRANEQIIPLSAGLSAQQITIPPLGISAPAMLIFLCSDQPIDVRTNSPTDTNFLSAVQLLCLAGYISNIYVTTPSTATTLMLKAAGGSNASVQVTFPLP